MVRSNDSAVVGAPAVAIATLGFFAWSVVRGTGLGLGGLTPLTIAVLIASGLAGIVLGVWLAFALMRCLGIVRVRLLNLLMPVFVGVASLVILGEGIRAAQIPFGLVLLAGCCLARAGASSAALKG
jgi:drug/metabolite transporter (DMT)-like permease